MLKKSVNDLFKDEEEGFPLLFEIVPPAKGRREKRLQEHTEFLERLFDSTDITALNLPEIHDESQKGDKGKRRNPFKERVSPRDYARTLSERFDTDFVINHVVVKQTREEQEEWMLETRHEYGINNLILVGGESGKVQYPGPSVPACNRLAKRVLNRGRLKYTDGEMTPCDFSIGNICIPTRRKNDYDEPERMFNKLQAGADFFTSQIIAEAESPVHLLRDFSELLDEEEYDPPVIFWSFSPISGKKDIDFLRWLGVRIPEEEEHTILTSSDPASASITRAQTIWEKILECNDRLLNPLPMGINISVMGMRNFENGIRLAKDLNLVGVPD